jgi:hypothetical protein
LLALIRSQPKLPKLICNFSREVLLEALKRAEGPQERAWRGGLSVAEQLGALLLWGTNFHVVVDCLRALF